MKNAVVRPSVESVSKVAVLPLGMHRSGTSALAGVLHNLGCVGPRNPMPGNEWNAKGFFESLPIYKLSDDILAAAGSKWNDWLPLNPGWQDGPRFSEFRSRARELIASEYGTSSLIYLKDPRLCRLLPFWTDVLEDLGFRVLHVNIHRNPVDVAESLHTRNGLDRGLATLIWLRHVLDAEAASRGRPRIFTSFDSILKDWAGFVDQSEAAFGFVWPRQSQKAAKDIRTLLSPTLRHHNSDETVLMESPLTSGIVKETLRIFDAWTRDGESAEDHPRLDVLRAQLDTCAPLFADTLSSLESDARSNAAKIAKINDAIRDAAALHPGASADPDTGLNAADEVKALSEALAAAVSARDEAIAQAAAMAARLADLEARQQASDATQEDLSARLERTTSELAVLSNEVILATDRLIDRDKAAMASRHAMAKLEGDIARSATALEEERSKVRALQDSQARATEKLEGDIALSATALVGERSKVRALQDGQARATEKLEGDIARSAAALEGERANVRALQDSQARATEMLREAHARALEKQRQSFVNSTSWRLSAPVRVLGGLLKRGRRPSDKRR